MALSKKSLALLKKIYNHHEYGDEELVKEDPDEALEYVLQEIVENLSDPDLDSAPLHSVTEDAVGGLRLDRADRRREAEKQTANEAQEAKTS